MKTTLFSLIGLLVWITFFTGCATTKTTTAGEEFDTLKINQIVEGKTTTNEVTAIFGAPYTKQTNVNDEETWLYFSETSVDKSKGLTPGGAAVDVLMFGVPGLAVNDSPSRKMQSESLTINFDKQGIVKDFSLNKYK